MRVTLKPGDKIHADCHLRIELGPGTFVTAPPGEQVHVSCDRDLEVAAPSASGQLTVVTPLGGMDSLVLRDGRIVAVNHNLGERIVTYRGTSATVREVEIVDEPSLSALARRIERRGYFDLADDPDWRELRRRLKLLDNGVGSWPSWR